VHLISIHKAGEFIGNHISLKIDKPENAQFLGYGAEILLGSLVKLWLLFAVAFILDIIFEVTILLIVTGIIRTLSGGAHCSSHLLFQIKKHS